MLFINIESKAIKHNNALMLCACQEASVSILNIFTSYSIHYCKPSEVTEHAFIYKHVKIYKISSNKISPNYKLINLLTSSESKRSGHFKWNL